MSKMVVDVAILFWCYKDPALCVGRLNLIRNNNPRTKIYVLFGGKVSEREQFEDRFKGLIDDFYCFPHPWEPRKKWEKGELLIVDWYLNRGHRLQWDTISIIQADMLIFSSLNKLFSNLNKNELILSELRPIKEVEANWAWTSSKDPKVRNDYEEFVKILHANGDKNNPLLCCLFVVACLPKDFLKEYSEWDFVGKGFLEYSIPSFAAAKKFRVSKDRNDVDWNFENNKKRKKHLSATG